MLKKMAVVVGVLIAAACVLALKATLGGSALVSSAPPEPRATVTLVADMREADASCGCGQIIQLARKAAAMPGVAYAEHDTHTDATAAERFALKGEVAVIIATKDKGEQRFDGEGKAVVNSLSAAITALDSGGT